MTGKQGVCPVNMSFVISGLGCKEFDVMSKPQNQGQCHTKDIKNSTSSSLV